MATFTFKANAPDSYVINTLSQSGLSLMGTTFGDSVAVGEYNLTTWISNSTGSLSGPQTNNVQYLNAYSGVLNSATSGVGLLAIPNYLSTVIIEFSHSSAVRLQNTKVYIYDRVDKNNPASGVTTKVAEIIHPTLTQVNDGSGSQVWQTPAGSSYMSLTPSPGRSGFYVNGPLTTDVIHTHYLAISQSPNSVGSKNSAIWVETEYL